MSSTPIDFTGYPRFLTLHNFFRISDPYFTEVSDEHKAQLFRRRYIGLPEDARSLWCMEARSERLPSPEDHWNQTPEPVKEFWRIRALRIGPSWSDREAREMDDPGYTLFLRRHQNAKKASSHVLDFTEYNLPLPEVWDTLDWLAQVLWREDATDLIEPHSTLATDPSKLYSQYANTENGEDGEEELLGDADYEIAMKEVFGHQDSHVRNFWVLKAAELRGDI